MLAFRFSLVFVCAFPASLGLAQGREKQPDQHPFLRIEAQMHTAMIRGLSISADGKMLATGSFEKRMRLWSLPEGRLLKTIRVPIGDGEDRKLYATALSPDGRLRRSS